MKFVSWAAFTYLKNISIILNATYGEKYYAENPQIIRNLSICRLTIHGGDISISVTLHHHVHFE